MGNLFSEITFIWYQDYIWNWSALFTKLASMTKPVMYWASFPRVWKLWRIYLDKIVWSYFLFGENNHDRFLHTVFLMYGCVIISVLKCNPKFNLKSKNELWIIWNDIQCSLFVLLIHSLQLTNWPNHSLNGRLMI